VYVFTRSAGVWSQQAYLKPAAVGTTQSGDQFGWSVAVSGDTVVVGALFEDSSTTGINSTPDEAANGAGAAYVFARIAGVWSQQAYLKPAAVGTSQSADHFGFSAGVSGDTVVLGAPNEASSTTGVNSVPNESAVGSGTAYVFVLAPSSVNITVNTSPSGLSFVASGAGCAPGNYFSPQVLSWTPGSACTLTVATPQNNFAFSQWEDASTNPARGITAPAADATYTATFVPLTIGATVNTSPSGLSFTSSGAGCAPGNYVSPQVLTWTAGSSCTLTVATPQGSAIFAQWEDASTNPVRAVIAPAFNTSYTATFVVSFGLTITATPSGLGSVTYDAQSCANVCSANYTNGAVVALTAVPASGYTFSGWSGACSGTGACTVTMDAAKSVTATFAAAGATVLSATLGIKSGPVNARIWPVVFTNTGPGGATNISITAFTLMQTLGVACTPVVSTAMPVSVGTIPAAGTLTSNVTIDFTGCAGTARFRLTMPFTSNGGVNAGTTVINNQFQ
jgi:uncharacterized repeat protein (TIGR02543 family)